MKCNVSIPERMKDLRVERHLSLEELEAAVGISKSALGSYESTEGCKEINHGSILKLADFYQVSTDYLLCRTDNRNPENIELTELHIKVGALRSPKAPRRRAVIFRSHGLLQIKQGTLRFPCAGCRQLPFCGLAIWGHLALQVVPSRQVLSVELSLSTVI